jgi:hypothetical protein
MRNAASKQLRASRGNRNEKCTTFVSANRPPVTQEHSSNSRLPERRPTRWTADPQHRRRRYDRRRRQPGHCRWCRRIAAATAGVACRGGGGACVAPTPLLLLLPSAQRLREVTPMTRRVRVRRRRVRPLRHQRQASRSIRCRRRSRSAGLGIASSVGLSTRRGGARGGTRRRSTRPTCAW